MKAIALVVVSLLLGALLMGALNNFHPRGAVGGGGGGGWGEPTNASTVIPGWVWEVGWYLAEKLIDSLNDCGINTTCNSANQPPTGVGGGGGGGFGGDGPTNLPNNARKPMWNWFEFSQESK